MNDSDRKTMIFNAVTWAAIFVAAILIWVLG